MWGLAALRPAPWSCIPDASPPPAEPRHPSRTLGGLPRLLQEVHALAAGADFRRHDQRLPGQAATVRAAAVRVSPGMAQGPSCSTHPRDGLGQGSLIFILVLIWCPWEPTLAATGAAGLSGRACEAGECMGLASRAVLRSKEGDWGQDAWVLSRLSMVGLGAEGWGMDPFLHPGALQLVPARYVPVPQC